MAHLKSNKYVEQIFGEFFEQSTFVILYRAFKIQKNDFLRRAQNRRKSRTNSHASYLLPITGSFSHQYI